MTTMIRNPTQVELKFIDFYEKWMGQLEDFLQLLLVVSKEQNPDDSIHVAAVNKLTAHHKEYYTFKWAAANEDVLAVFTPAWLSPLESAHNWVTGWKPSTAFRILENLRGERPPAGFKLLELTEEQARRIDGLKARIKSEEEKVESEMERQQVGMADRSIVELAKLQMRTKRGGVERDIQKVDKMVDAAVKGLMLGLEKVMKMADCARLKTLKGVLDVLTPEQAVNFLAAKAMLQIQMRKLGMMREGRSAGAGGGGGNAAGQDGEGGAAAVV